MEMFVVGGPMRLGSNALLSLSSLTNLAVIPPDGEWMHFCVTRLTTGIKMSPIGLIRNPESSCDTG